MELMIDSRLLDRLMGIRTTHLPHFQYPLVQYPIPTRRSRPLRYIATNLLPRESIPQLQLPFTHGSSLTPGSGDHVPIRLQATRQDSDETHRWPDEPVHPFDHEISAFLHLVDDLECASTQGREVLFPRLPASMFQCRRYCLFSKRMVRDCIHQDHEIALERGSSS